MTNVKKGKREMKKKSAKSVEVVARPVLVCTEHRGVFFGYAAETRGNQIDLKRGRNVLYWPSENKGFVGLAAFGPMKGAKIGPAADMDVRKVTCVLEVTPEAVTKFEAAPWG